MAVKIRECSTYRCAFCHHIDREGRVTDRVRPITDADLRWWLCDAQAQLGVRSAFGSAFSYRAGKDGTLDLVFCPVGGSGGNSAERSWDSPRKRKAAARERCISGRLRGVDPFHLAVLVAAYSPNTLASRAERVTGDRDARVALTDAFGEILSVVPLTDGARRALAPAAAVVQAGEASQEEYVVEAGGLELAVVARRRSGEDLYDAVETDESLRGRCIADGGGVLPAEHAGVYSTYGFRLDWAAEEIGVARHELHVRRWAGDEVRHGFFLAQLARLAQAAERAKKRDTLAQGRKRALNRAEGADQRDRLVVQRLCDEARAMLKAAHEALGVESFADQAGPSPRPRAPKREKAKPKPAPEPVYPLIPGIV